MEEEGREGYNVVLFDVNSVIPAPKEKIRHIRYESSGICDE
jgi:hypothetical protein